MATTTRQTNLFVSEIGKKFTQTFSRYADFQSYDFETLRTTMISSRRNFQRSK